MGSLAGLAATSVVLVAKAAVEERVMWVARAVPMVDMEAEAMVGMPAAASAGAWLVAGLTVGWQVTATSGEGVKEGC